MKTSQYNPLNGWRPQTPPPPPPNSKLCPCTRDLNLLQAHFSLAKLHINSVRLIIFSRWHYDYKLRLVSCTPFCTFFVIFPDTYLKTPRQEQQSLGKKATLGLILIPQIQSKGPYEAEQSTTRNSAGWLNLLANVRIKCSHWKLWGRTAFHIS